jgi:3',5'-cyclic AMP phosphodiesterase CpdA
MFRLAHLSDPHLGPLPSVKRRQLASKRLIGYINWHRKRGKGMLPDTLEKLMDDMLAQTPDHIAVTGDLVNIALPEEFKLARAFLESLGPPDYISVVPGNHDAYVPGAAAKAKASWLDYMSSDPNRPMLDRQTEDAVSTKSHHYPYVRIRDFVRLIGVSSARATAPFFATGTVGESQMKRLGKQLENGAKNKQFRIVMIHHPPFKKATDWYKRLIGASRFRGVIKRVGAELILHGHTHLPTITYLEGPDGSEVPVIGVPSASQGIGGNKPPASYNLFEISETQNGWNAMLTRRGFGTSATIDTIESRQFELQHRTF